MSEQHVIDDNGIEHLAQQVKHVFIYFLYNNGFINEDVAADLDKNYAILVKEPSFFSKLWKNEDKKCWIVVKQQSMTDDDESKEEEKSE